MQRRWRKRIGEGEAGGEDAKEGGNPFSSLIWGLASASASGSAVLAAGSARRLTSRSAGIEYMQIIKPLTPSLLKCKS